MASIVPQVGVPVFLVAQRLSLPDSIIQYPGGQCDLQRINAILTELGEMTPEEAFTDDRPEIRGLAKFIRRMIEEESKWVNQNG
jgi:hypothetical protein